jgi:hypothetical protein
VELLAVSEGDVKDRVVLACQELSLAVALPSADVPECFVAEVRVLLGELRPKSSYPGSHGFQAGLHRKHLKTVSKYARRIWGLYNHYEDFFYTGVVPDALQRLAACRTFGPAMGERPE